LGPEIHLVKHWLAILHRYEGHGNFGVAIPRPTIGTALMLAEEAIKTYDANDPSLLSQTIAETKESGGYFGL